MCLIEMKNDYETIREQYTNEHHPHHHPTNRPRNRLHQRCHRLKPGLPPAVRIQQSQRRKESSLIRRG